MNFANRTIWTADNIEILPGIDSECVDLVYLDPPFNSNRNYAAPVGSKAAGAAFKDTWTYSDLDVAAMGRLADTYPGVYAVIEASGLVHGKGMMSYLVMMADRLVELHRLLKPTGSIYLHCDPFASHYLKYLLDAIFRHQSFRSEVIWKRSGGKSDARRWGITTDRLLFFTKSDHYTWNQQYRPHDAEYVSKTYRYNDNDDRGPYTTMPVHAAGVRTGESGLSWNGYDPSMKGRHWATPVKGVMHKYIVENSLIPDWPDAYPTVHKRLDALNVANLITSPPNKRSLPRLKTYLSASRGVAATDLVSDIRMASGNERTGYPTQKPLALLERIISASSNEGDVVLDPFCGCATTLIAAERLGRRWAGIDISPKAVDLVRYRMAQTNLDLGGRHLSVHTRAPSRSDGTKMPRRQIRHTLYGQQEGDCNGCREHFAFHMLEVDHVWPRSKGGPNTLENSQLLCRHCNSLKATGTMDDLAVKLSAWQRGGTRV